MRDTVVTALNLATSAATFSQSNNLDSFLRCEPRVALYLNIATLAGNIYRFTELRSRYAFKLSERVTYWIKLRKNLKRKPEERSFFDLPIPRYLTLFAGFAVAGVALNRIFIPSKNVIPFIDGAKSVKWSVPRSQDVMQFVTICNLALNAIMAKYSKNSSTRYHGAISSLANAVTLASTASIKTICVETEKTFLPAPLKSVTIGYDIAVQGRQNLQALKGSHSYKPFSEVAQKFVDEVRETGGKDALLGVSKKVGFINYIFGQRERYELTLSSRYFGKLWFSNNQFSGYCPYSGLFGTWKGAVKVVLKGARFFD